MKLKELAKAIFGTGLCAAIAITFASCGDKKEKPKTDPPAKEDPEPEPAPEPAPETGARS